MQSMVPGEDLQTVTDRNQLRLPLNVLSGSEASRTARLRPIPEEQPVISTTFLSMELTFTEEQLEQSEEESADGAAQ